MSRVGLVYNDYAVPGAQTTQTGPGRGAHKPMLLSQSTSNLGRDVSTQLSMRTANQTHFDPRKASWALPQHQIDTKSGGMLKSDEY